MAIVSQGQLTVRPSDYGDPGGLQNGASWWAQDGLSLLHSFATYGQIYRSKLWVATLVNKLGGSLARLPYKSYFRQNEGRGSARGSAFGQLMANPCPIPGHDPVFFWLWTASVQELYGESIWVKVRDPQTKLPIALYPLHPANLTIRKQADGRRVYEWRLTASATGSTLSWPAEDVVHFKGFNPDTLTRGMSRLEPLHADLVADTAMRTAQDSLWANGARPSVVLRYPGTLEPKARNNLRSSWEAAHSGVRNHGKAVLLEEDISVETMQLTPAEMEYVNSLKVTRDEACSLYDVPPPVVHILDKATFSNITEQMRSMYRDTMGLRLPVYESAINSQLAAEFGDRYYGEFLLDDVLRGDFEQRWTAYRTAVQTGGMMPFVDGSDRLLVNAAMIPIEMAGQEVRGAPALGPSADEQAGTTTRTIMSRLGRATNPSAVSLAALTAGLKQEIADLVAVHLIAAVNEGHDMATLRENLNTALTEEVSYV